MFMTLPILICILLSEQKMASSVYDPGYKDELFQYPVGPSLHCCICTNVIRDPVMCHNERIFCRACITRHLMNSQTCPTCMEPLTVETIRQAPRGVRNMIAELQIRCEFFDRGCREFVQLGDLERHVADCGFAPAVCSNEGCQREVNRQDLLHHETAVCELRGPKCHNCNDIRKEMDTVKVNLAAINEKLDRSEKDLKRMEALEENQKGILEEVKEVKENLTATFELVQEQLDKQKESNRQLRADNEKIKKSLNEIMKQLQPTTQQTPNEVQAEQISTVVAETGGVEEQRKVVIAGGVDVNFVEMFSLETKTWTPLQPMNKRRCDASSVVYNNQIIVTAGGDQSVEQLTLNAVQVDHSIPWENIPVQLPARAGHCNVVYNERFIMIGGYEVFACSDSITEISLVPPYTSKLLATMPRTRYHHGVAIFGDKILIVGGMETRLSSTPLRSVIMYDITNNKFQELTPLPYPAHEMATVKWEDDYVILMGGSDRYSTPTNKVLMYNIKTQKSHELPDMKYKRKGCVAAVLRDTVIVMGGSDESGNSLRSVESFRFDRKSWEELPPMHKARYQATAVTC